MSRKITVTHISSGDLWAGAEVQLFQTLASAAYRQNLAPSVIVFNEGELASRLRSREIPVKVITEKAHSALRIVGAIRSTLRDQRPSILHTHGYKENILGSLAALGLGIPVCLRTEHGSPEHRYGWRQLPQKLIRSLDRWIARHMQAAVIAVSPDLCSRLNVLYPGKVHQIVNAIDVESVRAQTHPRTESQGGMKIGIVGRLVPVKRVDLFLETLALLKQRGRGLEGIVIGDGPLRASLVARAQALGLEGLTTFTGFLNPVQPALADLDALVMCSDHEGLPMTLLEAMALKVGVIGHAVGGIPYVLEDGAAGILVRQQTPEAYADAIENWIQHPELRQRFLDRASDRVKDEFDSNRLGQEYVRLYRDLLEKAS